MLRKKKRPCVHCGKPILFNGLYGRPRKYCSYECRDDARRTRNFVGTGHTRSGDPRNDSTKAEKSDAFETEKSGRASGTDPRRAIEPDLWEFIVERETGLPKPPVGMQTVVNLRSADRRPHFVAALVANDQLPTKKAA